MNCECFFCGDQLFKLNKEIGIAFDKAIIYEDENIFITPDIAPVIEGHFLIVSKIHENSFANVDDDTYFSLERAKEHLRSCIFKNRKILFFEHGAVIEGYAGACIDHAHMHVIPITSDIDIDDYISFFVTHDKISASKENLFECAKNRQPYIYYEIEKNETWFYPVKMLPRQFFRMMVANHFSVANYRWGEKYRTPESKELFDKTLQLGNNNKI